MPQPARSDRSVRAGARPPKQLYQLRHVSPAGVGVESWRRRPVFPAAVPSAILMPQLAFPILCRTARGSRGAWQKFERGEMALFPFYAQFGRELSDTSINNPAYVAYCGRRGTGAPSPLLASGYCAAGSWPRAHVRTPRSPCGCRCPASVPVFTRRSLTAVTSLACPLSLSDQRARRCPMRRCTSTGAR